MAKILVVEDEPDIRRTLQIAFESQGYKVLAASSRQEAEAVAVAENPDLMIVDVMMPEGTEGLHLVWQIQQMKDEALSNVPIIMATGIHETTELRFYPDQTDGTWEPGEFLPVQAWIDKPVKVDDLLGKMDRLLG